MTALRRAVKHNGWMLFAVAVLLYALLWGGWILCQGYGADDGDVFRMLRTWQTIHAQKIYFGSRFQGSIVAEMLLGFAASLGGPALANSVSLSFAVLGFAALGGVARHFGVRPFLLVAAAFFANGLAVIAAATSTDYMIAFGLFAIGFYLMVIGEDAAGIVLMSASAGARISYSIVALITVGFVLLYRHHILGQRLRRRTLVLDLATTFFVSGLFFLPIWIQHGLEFDWINSVRPTRQGFSGLVARFLYKVFMMVTISGTVLGGLGALWDLRRAVPSQVPQERRAQHWFLIYCAVIISFHLLLFLYIPAKQSYLLPALAFAVLMLGRLNWRYALAGLAIGELIAGLVILDPLTISYRSQDVCEGVLATGAHLSPHFSRGSLLANEHDRDANIACGLPLLKFAPADLYGPLPDGAPR